jgi:hypothetical protein
MSAVTVTVKIIQTAFKNGLDSMKAQAQKWSSDVKGMMLGAFATGAIISGFNSLRAELDRVGKLATRLNVLPSTIEKIGHAASLAGTNVEEVVKAMAKLAMAAATSGEAFAKTGIDAQAFMGADVEEQLKMLSAAYVAAGNDMEKLIEIQKLLGEEGQNLIPLLIQGPDALSASMGNSGIAIDLAVKATEAFNDALTKVGREAKMIFGGLILAAKQFKAFMGEAFTGGSFQDGMNAIAAIQEEHDKAVVEMAKARKAALETSATENAAKQVEEARKAFESVSKQLEDRALKRLDTEGQILALQEKQLIAMERMEDASLSVDERAKAAKETLDLQEKIEAAQAKQLEEAKQAEEEMQRLKEKEAEAAKAVADAEAKVAAEEDRQTLAAMNPADRAAELQKRQAALFAESDQAKGEGDNLTSAEKRLEGLQMADSIASALAEAAPEIAAETEERRQSSVVSSSLSAVGGGGGSFVSGMDPQLSELKNQTRLLEQIAQSANMTAQQQPQREVF